MSADLWLSYEAGGECEDEECQFLHSFQVFNINVTYNLSPMLRKCGWKWDRERLDGKKAADIAEAVEATLIKLKADPEKFREMNPPNGWGTYDGLVEQWERFSRAVAHYPDAIVGTSL